MNWCSQNKTITVLRMTFVFLVVLSLCRPASVISGVPPELFWVNKFSWQPEYDVVFAGDSRVYRGVSPKIFQQAFQRQIKVGNFGFSGNGFGGPYLSHLRQLLRLEHRAVPKILILGVTPNALSDDAANRDNGYLTLTKENPLEHIVQKNFGELLHAVRPWTSSDVKALWQQFLSRQPKGYFQTYS